MTMNTNIDQANVTEPIIKNRYCQMANAECIWPTAQDRNPLMIELAAAKTRALRGGCSLFL
jgi:hypothetical protein